MAIKKQFKGIKLPSETGSLLQYIEDNLTEGGFNVYICDKRKGRTMPQNRYYWGVVLKVISDDSGIDAEDLHEYFKKRFTLRTEFNMFKTGEGYTGTPGGLEVFNGLKETPMSTKAMSTKEFTEYIDKIIRWSADKGITIPSPNEIPEEWLVEIMNQTY